MIEMPKKQVIKVGDLVKLQNLYTPTIRECYAIGLVLEIKKNPDGKTFNCRCKIKWFPNGVVDYNTPLGYLIKL